jgi:putative peptidoglycan lipid II flippase
VRIVLTVGLGWLFAFPLPRLLGIDPRWGVAGLTASAGIAGWVEFMLLRRALGRRIGRSGVPTIVLARLWLGALIAAGAAWAVKPLVEAVPNLVRGIVVCGVFGLVYLGVTTLLGEGEAYRVVRAVRRRIGGAR